MTGLRPNRPLAEALQAELTAENEQSGDPESGPGNEDSLTDQVARAWEKIEAAPDDDEWVEWFLIWLELHRLLMLTL